MHSTASALAYSGHEASRKTNFRKSRKVSVADTTSATMIK